MTATVSRLASLYAAYANMTSVLGWTSLPKPKYAGMSDVEAVTQMRELHYQMRRMMPEVATQINEDTKLATVVRQPVC